MDEARLALREFIERYGFPAGEEGPVLMVREVFAVEPDPWQEKVLRSYGRGDRRISIRACHGPGKTAVAAWIVWHMLLTKFPQKSVATAPSRGQLEDALEAEVLSWSRHLPPILRNLYEFKKNRIYLIAAPEDSFFSARTARAEKPEALQGVHSENVLLIADEASGVPEAIFEAAVGSMSGHNATTLLLGNPVRSSGLFFDTHHKLRDMWTRFHISADDSPRVTDDFCQDVARRYGEHSNAYRVRVLGEFPLADQDTIIPFELIESAMSRDIIIPDGAAEVWGLDVARFGDDSNVLLRRASIGVRPQIDKWSGTDLMQTAGRVKRAWDETPVPLRPRYIMVDVIGLGAGVVDRLRELSLPVRGVNVSEMAALKDQYINQRAELWFTARHWLEQRDTTLPSGSEEAEDLAAQLGLLRYSYTSTGRIRAEPKAEVKKRGHLSPNVADAFILTFAVEPSALIGGGSGYQWQQAEVLRRDIPVV